MRSSIHWQRELPSGRRVVNVGALGRPANDGRTEVWYSFYDSEQAQPFEFIPVPYDYRRLARETRREWLLQEVSVRLRHSRIHAEDCANCETKEGMLDRIDSEIELSGALSAEQRAKLLEIAKKCPIHRTLTSEIEIRTQLT